MKTGKTMKLLVGMMLILCFGVSLVQGAGFPEKEIKVIVPWAPGGASDIMARQLQPIIKNKFKINIVVENAEGGNSAVGLTQVITSRNDGYTVGVASSTILSLMGQKQINWDIDKFTNIMLISEDPLLLLVKKDAPWKTLKDFMDDVKSKPGEITVGNAGSRNVNHAMAILMAQSVGSQIRQVPFSGAAPTMAALLGGHIKAAVMKPSESLANIEAGEIKALGVYRDKRLATLPNVPTFAENGYDIFQYGAISQISFIVAPAGLKPAVRERLAKIFSEAARSEEYQKYAANAGFVCEPITGEALDRYIKEVRNGLQNVSEKLFK